jgi:predicted nucleic acid-binding protein
VADASPLIGLARIQRLEILVKLFDEILIPEQVAKECTADLNQPGATIIVAAIKNKLLKVKTIAFDELLSFALDPGEVEAIALAKKLACPILLDDRTARVIARAEGLKVIGLAGLLIVAKQHKVIRKVKPLLEELQQANYFLGTKLIKEILTIANELQA